MTTKQKLDISRTPQFDFFSGVADKQKATEPKKECSQTGRRFVAPDASAITLGGATLQHHLEQADQKTPMMVASILDEQDWSSFEDRYACTGRPPYAPRNMVGLIFYGIMQGVTSLRSLERLARLELGCMWVSGGIFPDHANIGRFINMHEASLTGDFFDELTRTVLTKTHSSGQCLAGDGTTIEAACSNYNLIKE